MWNGNLVASQAPLNYTYIDQPEYNSLARNFRTCRVTSMAMEVAVVSTSVADGRYMTGGTLAAGDGGNFPFTVP